MLPVLVWDAGVLEDNPPTYPEVQALLEGNTVGGHRASDQKQILNIAAGTQRLLDLVKRREFLLSKDVFTELNGLIARNEALESGRFRGDGIEVSLTPDVALGAEGRYTAPATEPGRLCSTASFRKESGYWNRRLPTRWNGGLAFFLFGALQQFFFDGNKRTSRLIMNGVLMSSGIDALSVPAARVEEFNTRMGPMMSRIDDRTVPVAKEFMAATGPAWTASRALDPQGRNRLDKPLRTLAARYAHNHSTQPQNFYSHYTEYLKAQRIGRDALNADSRAVNHGLSELGGLLRQIEAYKKDFARQPL